MAMRHAPGLRALRWGAALLSVLIGPAAEAVVTAHVDLYRVDGGCLVNSQETPSQGDPERFFRAGFFDQSSTQVLGHCATGCSADTKPETPDGATLDYCTYSRGCDQFAFPLKSLSKVTPAHAGVYFYFGLYDVDDDESDLLGDIWLYLEGSSAGPLLNNNASPYRPAAGLTSACGRTLEGAGTSGDYSLSYSAWFEDSTPPDVLTPVATDDGIAGVVYDNDDVLAFQWPAPVDADSGVASTDTLRARSVERTRTTQLSGPSWLHRPDDPALTASAALQGRAIQSCATVPRSTTFHSQPASAEPLSWSAASTWKSDPRQAPGGGDTMALFGGSPSTRTCP